MLELKEKMQYFKKKGQNTKINSIVLATKINLLLLQMESFKPTLLNFRHLRKHLPLIHQDNNSLQQLMQLLPFKLILKTNFIKVKNFMEDLLNIWLLLKPISKTLKWLDQCKWLKCASKSELHLQTLINNRQVLDLQWACHQLVFNMILKFLSLLNDLSNDTSKFNTIQFQV